jgi:hypothetical protein
VESQVSTAYEVRKGFIAFIFSVLATALIASAGAVIAAYNMGMVADAKLSFFQRELDKHQAEYIAFRDKGGRFTSEDGARHDARIAELEKARTICADRTLKLEYELNHLNDEQEKLCARVGACAINNKR